MLRTRQETQEPPIASSLVCVSPLVLHLPSRSSSSSQKEIKGNVRNFSGFIAFNWHVTYSRKPQGGMSFGRRAGNEKRLRNFLIFFPCSPLSPSSSFWVFAPAFWWFRIANKSYEVIMARRPGEAAPARWGERSCHGPGVKWKICLWLR